MSRARHRKSGGRTDMWVSGNPDVKKEAEGREPYDKGDEKKRGGKVKKKRASGGKVLGFMDGGAVRPRLDRPGRKRGGGVGADRSPLSSANRKSSAESEPRESADSN
jgi:hypothetical protein